MSKERRGAERRVGERRGPWGPTYAEMLEVEHYARGVLNAEAIAVRGPHGSFLVSVRCGVRADDVTTKEQAKAFVLQARANE